MIGMENILFSVLVLSSISGLTTEALKKVFSKEPENLLACGCSIVISVIASIGYVMYFDLEVTPRLVVILISHMFVTWLTSMLGYDKIIQTIGQIKEKRK